MLDDAFRARLLYGAKEVDMSCTPVSGSSNTCAEPLNPSDYQASTPENDEAFGGPAVALQLHERDEFNVDPMTPPKLQGTPEPRPAQDTAVAERPPVHREESMAYRWNSELAPSLGGPVALAGAAALFGPPGWMAGAGILMGGGVGGLVLADAFALRSPFGHSPGQVAAAATSGLTGFMFGATGVLANVIENASYRLAAASGTSAVVGLGARYATEGIHGDEHGSPLDYVATATLSAIFGAGGLVAGEAANAGLNRLAASRELKSLQEKVGPAWKELAANQGPEFERLLLRLGSLPGGEIIMDLLSRGQKLIDSAQVLRLVTSKEWMGTALKVSVQKAEAVLQWAGELSGHLHQMTASYWPARIKEHLPADLMEKVKGLVPLAEQVVSLCKEEITKHAQDATKTAGKAIGDLRNSYTTPDVHARALVSLREVRASVKTAEASGQKHYAEALEEIEKGWNTALVEDLPALVRRAEKETLERLGEAWKRSSAQAWVDTARESMSTVDRLPYEVWHPLSERLDAVEATVTKAAEEAFKKSMQVLKK